MTLKTVKMIIEYDGTNFYGWQRQSKLRSVQGELERVLSKIFKKTVEINGSGRTDAGVHAYGQVATFQVEVPMPLENLKIALNNYLAEDVRVIELSFQEELFHARYSSKGKTYVYKVHNSNGRDVFLSNYTYSYPYKLDMELMIEASKILIGEHDFLSFMASGSSVVNTVRNISSIEITKSGDIITFIYTGDGFLYKMIRILTAFLLEIGNKRLDLDITNRIFEKPSRKYTSKVAPANGLYLKEVYY